MTTTVESAHALDPLFRPASVAVVGVSTSPTSPGARTFANLVRHFDGEVFGVNPAEPEIEGRRLSASLTAIGEPPDLVVIATPAESVLDILTEAGELGVKAAIVLSAGFAEAGEEGRRLQGLLAETARRHGMALIGPNSMGMISRPNSLFATFTNAVQEANAGGRVAVVGQSGGMAAIIYTICLAHGVGVDYLVALGNESATSLGEVVEWMMRPESGVDAVLGFVESLSGWDELAAAARMAAESQKVIAFCRAGRSQLGAAAAGSHIGAVAGDEKVLADLAAAGGIVEAATLDDLLDIAKARHVARPMRGRRVGVVTASGGAGSLFADLMTSAGLDLPELSPELQKKVFEVIPWFGSATNPVDTTAFIQSRPEEFCAVAGILAASGEVDAVMVFLGTLDPIAPRLVRSLTEIAARHPAVPVVVTWGGGSKRFKEELWRAGVATFDDPDRAVQALVGLAPARRVAAATGPVNAPSPFLDPLPGELTGGRSTVTLNEHDVRRLLEAAGLPVPAGALAADADRAVAIAAEIQGEVVLKLIAPGLEHKSDIGGVVVGVSGADEVRRQAERLFALGREHGSAVDGVLVEQRAPAGIELVCGVRRDRVAGPVVVVGLGGVLTEIIGEMAVRAAPLTRGDALDALEQLFAGRLLNHHRGLGPAAAEAVADLLVRLGDIIAATDRLVELECNPVIVSEAGALICDGLAVVGGDPDDSSTGRFLQ
ncbi:acetate--CoA ligase family protein [Actinomadura livida]|uniref:Acetate--CoA ligase family protein n=1 Tax=Actinomadura livida TaxID=79909 RepID=A0A7W7IAS6_9ACTN|nr:MULTISPECIES: acetate--CoA ligase family protein [Actinomadura]MBB4773605.1 acyl-CoA synthetase (NDP forming) [Actinomadura catellatispora]GGU09460.1 pimeloyl-CoA synthetase [Actinomadura livida]